MGLRDVNCPSGMKGTVRGLMVKEANLIASATRSKRQEMIDSVLTGCWQGITNPGPYDFGDGSIPRWNDVLQGDMQYLLIQIRAATYGDDYHFPVQCTDEICRERFEWGLDLSDLPMQMLSKEDAERFKDGNRFDVVLDDRKYVFNLPTGQLAKRAIKHKKNNRATLVTFALRMRTVEVEGVESNMLRDHFNSLDMGTAQQLIAEFDEHDCGIDGELDIECPECGNIMEITLPFEGDFFMPKKKRKTEPTTQENTAA